MTLRGDYIWSGLEHSTPGASPEFGALFSLLLNTNSLRFSSSCHIDHTSVSSSSLTYSATMTTLFMLSSVLLALSPTISAQSTPMYPSPTDIAGSTLPGPSRASKVGSFTDTPSHQVALVLQLLLHLHQRAPGPRPRQAACRLPLSAGSVNKVRSTRLPTFASTCSPILRRRTWWMPKRSRCHTASIHSTTRAPCPTTLSRPRTLYVV